MSRSILALVVALVIAPASVARAEMWPSLDDYVADCTLIVKAKTIEEDKKLTFRVLETWRGVFDPKRFTEVTRDGRFFAENGEHGVKVIDGQEIVFFFTLHNQPDPKKLSRHSTAFPISDGTVVYASTGDQPRNYKLADFKRAVMRVPAAKPK
jgi:hypothetical protein